MKKQKALIRVAVLCILTIALAPFAAREGEIGLAVIAAGFAALILIVSLTLYRIDAEAARLRRAARDRSAAERSATSTTSP